MAFTVIPCRIAYNRRTGGLVIGWVNFIFYIVALISFYIYKHPKSTDENIGGFFLMTVVITLYALLSASLIHGINTNQRNNLWWWLFFENLLTILWTAGIVIVLAVKVKDCLPLPSILLFVLLLLKMFQSVGVYLLYQTMTENVQNRNKELVIEIFPDVWSYSQ